MENGGFQPKSDAAQRERSAESLLAEMFKEAGWDVRRPPQGDGVRPDFLIRRRGIAYAVEVKAGPEGRGDRLVPLFAQAVLQSARPAGPKVAPLAVVAAPKISARAAEQVIKFAEAYAPDAAVGVIDFEGLRMFRGPQLDEMNAQGKVPISSPGPSVRD